MTDTATLERPEKRRDLLQELSEERNAALELLERADRQFDGLAQEGYLNRTARDLWEDIRVYLRSVP